MLFKGFARIVFWSADIVNFYVLHNKSVLKVKVGVTCKLLWKIVKIQTKYPGCCIVCWIVQAWWNATFVISSFKITARLISATGYFNYINNCPTRSNTKQSFYYSASSLYMFRVSTTSIIRRTQNFNYSLRYWSYFLCSYLPPTWPSLGALEECSCTVPEAVVTVLFTPDDGCGWHPKHIEWTCRIINRRLCVASRWAIIKIEQRYTEP